MKNTHLFAFFFIILFTKSMVYSQILTITPDTVTQGQTLNIEVTAENIDFSQGTNVVTIKRGSFEKHISSTAKSSNTLVLNHTFNTDYTIGSYDLSIYTFDSNIRLSKVDAIYVRPDLTVASLDSISTDSAKQGDNITVILYGYNTNFDKGLNTVYLMNSSKKINASGTNVIDSTTLEVQFNFSYAYPTGLYSIYTKNNLDGTLSIANSFELNEGLNIPKITSISPDTVTQGQTLNIEITAENIDFSQGTNVVTIKRGSFEKHISSTAKSSNTLVLNHTFNSDYSIGSYDLSIYTYDPNITLSKVDAIYMKPDLTVASLDSISPDSAKQGDNITVILYGYNTNFDKGLNTVYLMNSSKKINASGTNVIDSTTLEVQFNFSYAYPTGLYSIYARNSLDGTLSIANSFELNEGLNIPKITSISPDTVTQGQTLNIEVTAENIDFSQGTNVVTIKQGSFEKHISSSVKNLNELILNQTFNSDYNIGSYDLSIYNYDSNITLSKVDAIYVKPVSTKALLDSISPDSAKQGDNITVILYGYNTNFDKGLNTVYLMNSSKKISASGTHFIDSTTLAAQFIFTQEHPVGVYSIYAKNDLDETLSIANSFELNEKIDTPAIISISPDTLTQGQTLEIEIAAEHIDFTQGKNVVSLKQNNTEIYMNSSSALDSNTLKTNISISNNSPTGIYTLEIWNTAFDITLVENQTLVKEDAIYLKSAVTGIDNQITNTDETMVFPNPASEYFVIKRQYNTLSIFDIQGRKVYETNEEQKIDISNFKNGSYLIQIKTENKTTTQKLIVE